MANEFPIHEILAVKNCDPREVRKRRIDEIIITANSADTRIRIKSGEDWIGEHFLLLCKHRRT
jgi:hypothetical protein